ncbi:hypothetical protein BH11PSE12_BH11PSE12_22260 [soil metagenome]
MNNPEKNFDITDLVEADKELEADVIKFNA